MVKWSIPHCSLHLTIILGIFSRKYINFLLRGFYFFVCLFTQPSFLFFFFIIFLISTVLIAVIYIVKWRRSYFQYFFLFFFIYYNNVGFKKRKYHPSKCIYFLLLPFSGDYTLLYGFKCVFIIFIKKSLLEDIIINYVTDEGKWY